MIKNRKIIFIGIIILLALSLAWILKNKTNQEELNLLSPVEKILKEETQELTAAKDSEGKMKITGTGQKLEDGNRQYSFKIVDLQKNSELPFFETNVPADTSITIPFNSWSPDSKQLFLEMNNSQGLDFFIFNANTEPYKDGQQYLKVADYWLKTKSKLRIKTATGWADPDLLIINTIDENGAVGPSFWFATSSRKFLQLNR